MNINIENYSDIQTLVLMSINTDKGQWWADSTFGSELYTLKGSKVNKETESIIRRMLIDCLVWIKTENLVKEIEITTEIKNKNAINYKIVITEPSEKNTIIEEVWQCQ